MGGPRGGEVTPLAPFIIFLGECERPVGLNFSFGLENWAWGPRVGSTVSFVSLFVVFVRLVQIKNEADDDGVMFFSSRDASLSLA